MINIKKLFKEILALSLAICIIASLLGVNAAAAGKTYYVSTAGKDNNTGTTLDTPFLTINKAIETAKAGDTVVVRGGIYKQKVTFGNSGSIGAPITLKNYNNEVPVLDGTGLSVTSDESAMVNLYDTSYVVIDGFEIRNLSTTTANTPMGILVDGSGKGIEIRNCTVHDIKTNNTTNSPSKTNAHGIAIYGSDGNTPIDGIILEGNEIYNCILGWSEALAVNGNVTNFKIINNKVHDNNNIGIVMIGYENTASLNDYARNGICSGNMVYNITSKYNPAYGYKKNQDGTYTLGECSSDGIYVDGGADILINQNILYNCDIGLEVATEDGPYAKNVTASNNLIYGCIGQAGISIGNAEDAVSQADNVVQNLTIVNNTLYGNAIDLQIQRVSDSTNVVKNNIFASSTKISGTAGKNVVSDNITSDPRFVNAANNDFHLQAGSLAIDKGVVMNYGAYDLDGAARVVGTAVDYGCYEYQTPPPPSTPTPAPSTSTTAPSTPTTAPSCKISGYVNVEFNYSAEAGRKIRSGFDVVIAEKKLYTKTDANGYFEITNVPLDGITNTMTISKPGYLKKTIINVKINGDKELFPSTTPILMMAGDIDQNNAINMTDIVKIAESFNSIKGSSLYSVYADFNADGVINMGDIMIAVRRFNKVSVDFIERMDG